MLLLFFIYFIYRVTLFLEPFLHLKFDLDPIIFILAWTLIQVERKIRFMFIFRVKRLFLDDMI